MISSKRSQEASVSDAALHRPPNVASSTDTVASNDDLLTEILLHLSIRSLIRFKSVSKHWLSLITHPNFSRLHRIHNPISFPSGLFLQLHRSSRLNTSVYEFVSFNDSLPVTPPFRTLTFVPDPSGLKILQSCNGLFFCCSSRTRELKRRYYVFNPTTKQFTTLPTLGSGFPTPIVQGVNFAFDPAKSPHYKVVCVRSSNFVSQHYQIEIYSSDTGPWRVSGEPFTAHVGIQFNGGVYWNGAIHWLSIRGDSLCFDVDRECLQLMPMPPLQAGSDRRWFNYFGESGDHLHLIEMYHPPSTQFNVYELERDHSRWFVKYRIDLGLVAAEFPETIQSNIIPDYLNFCNFVILSVVRGETKGESCLVLQVHGKAIRYNFEDKSFKTLCDFAPGRPVSFGGWSISFPFIESLSCV